MTSYEEFVCIILCMFLIRLLYLRGKWYQICRKWTCLCVDRTLCRYEIWGFRSGEDSSRGLMGCGAM